MREVNTREKCIGTIKKRLEELHTQEVSVILLINKDWLVNPSSS